MVILDTNTRKLGNTEVEKCYFRSKATDKVELSVMLIDNNVVKSYGSISAKLTNWFFRTMLVTFGFGRPFSTVKKYKHLTEAEIRANAAMIAYGLVAVGCIVKYDKALWYRADEAIYGPNVFGLNSDNVVKIVKERFSSDLDPILNNTETLVANY